MSDDRADRPHYSHNVDALVSRIHTARPRDLDADLADAFETAAIGVRECTRLIASIPYLWADDGEYRRLAARVADAAAAARAAYLAVDIRLRRAGGPNPLLAVVNDVLAVQGRAPLAPAGEIEAILTHLYANRAGLFFTGTEQGCIDRMLEQLARVPPSDGARPLAQGTPTLRETPDAEGDTPPSAATNQGEGGKPPTSRAKGIPLSEANVRVRDWLASHAKGNPAAITRDAVAAGAGVSTAQVSRTAAWQAFRDRRDAESRPQPRVVPLTDTMLGVIPADDHSQSDELARLIEEQQADLAEQDRPRRQRP